MSTEAERLNDLSHRIIAAAIDVHVALGPGLLESPYETCLVYELTHRGLRVERQKPYSLRYGDVILATAFRVDILVEDAVIVEVKAVERLTRVHVAQTLTYLRVAERKLALLFNFAVKYLMADGFRRLVHEFPDR